MAPSPRSPRAASLRPRVGGKFLYVGDEKLWIRGVTYGAFRPDVDGAEYHDLQAVERDFDQIAAVGLNTIRTYTVPPRWLLDSAQRRGLRVMVGLPWEEHVTFLDDRKRAREIVERVRSGVRACAGHPAVFCYAIGNEIPAPIVRWHGHRRVEWYIERLYRVAKAEDPDAFVTYVNYPTTEYLQLPFLDLVCFNVFLESQKLLEPYLARLHNIAGDRPLILTEIGLDSRRHGEAIQAACLDWQIRTAFASGCAGAVVFAWTDEWHRGGFDVKDWDFGLTNRDRRPKPALRAVRKAFADVPFPADMAWPRISVVVCSYNGARTIRDCLEGLQKLRYPDYEVIVVNDGSTDATPTIARQYAVRLINSSNGGLAAARNIGLEAATGEIVAYIDDDASPDPCWLTYLAATFAATAHAGVGGPNVPVPGEGLTAEGVANAPGAPMHVLLSDQEAEHIPGCNMAFRRACLQAIGGFDPQFRVAGDDVDVCWRLEQRGWTLGFHPGAMVWHSRRNSVRQYWKQQRGYGEAEALLERKWPQKYNSVGHLTWAGRVYSRGPFHWRKGRIYHGVWGSGPFQSLYQPAPSVLGVLPMMPEWYLVILGLGGAAATAALWRPLLIVVPLLAFAIATSIAQACHSAAAASLVSAPGSWATRLKVRALIAFLHILQPLARLCGRVRRGLTPLRRRGLPGFVVPLPRALASWSQHWQAPEEWLHTLEAAILANGAVVLRGGEYDRWDLEVRDGMCGSARILMAVEDHGAGNQLVRLRLWPRLSPGAVSFVLTFAVLAVAAWVDKAWGAAIVLGVAALGCALRTLQDCSTAVTAAIRTPSLDAHSRGAGRLDVLDSSHESRLAGLGFQGPPGGAG